MKLAVLAALCAFALASSRIPNSSWEREYYPEFELKEPVFRPDREYRYVYNGQLCTGIPGSSRQHSATRIQAVVSLVIKSPSQVLLKIVQARLGHLNRRLPNPQAMIPFMAFQQVPIEEELLEKLRQPVKFSYEKGMISEVVFDESEDAWSKNIKKGVLNMLQVNLHRHNPTDLGEEVKLTNRVPQSPNPEQDFFSVMEDTIEGQCETHYTLTSQPSPIYSSGPVLNVTKSINFEHCRRRPQIKYNFRFQEPCPTCNPMYSEDEKFLKSSTVMRFNISGTPEEFAIESAIVESQYTAVPFKRNAVVSYINQTLVLVNSGPIRTQVSGPKNPQPSDSQLIFSLDWDISKEKLHMEGSEEVQPHPFRALPNKLRICESVLRKLVREMTPELSEQVPEEFLRFVRVLRTLEPSELQQLHQMFMKSSSPKDFTPEQVKKVQSLLPEALAAACTKDTISHLIQKIKQRKVDPIQAAFAIKNLAACKVVSKEMIREMESLWESPICERNWFLKQAVALTTGSMLNALCSPNEDLLAMEYKKRPEYFCPAELKTEIVQKLIQSFKSAPSYYEKVLILKTLSNAGLPESVFELEKIIKNQEPENLTPGLRSEAIMALRQILKYMPSKVRKILMPIFMNSKMPSEMRIAAVYQIFETLPPRPILDQIASQLFRERRIQVASFVYSYMNALANATSNPCLKKFSRDLQLSLRHGRKISQAFRPGYSKIIYTSLWKPKYMHGLDISIASVMSPMSMMPRHMSLSFHRSRLGFWSKYLLTVGLTTRHLERHIYEYLDQFTEGRQDEFLVRSPRSSKSMSPMNELKRLFKSLSLKSREFSEPEPAQGYFYSKWMDQESTMIPFSPENIKEYVSRQLSSGSWSLEQLNSWLESGKNLHIYSGSLLSEMTFKIPTSLGLPLKASVAIPRVIKMTGQIKGQISPESVVLECNECNPIYAANLVAKVTTWTPMVASGVKVLVNAKVHVPMDAKLELSRPSNKEVEMKLRWTPPRSTVHWVLLETAPITFVSTLPINLMPYLYPQQRTIHGEEWTKMYTLSQMPVVRKTQQWIEKFLSIPMEIRGQWHHVPVAHLTETPVCPLSGPNKLVIVTRPAPEAPKEIIFKSRAKVSQPRRPIKSSFFDMSGEEPSFQDDEAWTAQLTSELKTKGCPKPCSMELDTKLSCSPEGRLCKLNSQFQRSRIPEHDPSPFKVCVTGQVLYPETPSELQQIPGKQIVSQLKATWGPSCQPKNFIKIQMNAEQSPEHQPWLQRNVPEYNLYSSERCQNKWECPPVQTYHTILQASNLHQYKIQCEWQNVSPIVKNLTNKVYHALKHYYYWNTDVNQIEVQNPEKELKVIFKISPRHRQLLNVTVQTPEERTKFMDIPMPMPIRPLNIRRKFSPYRLSQVFQEAISSGSGLCKITPRWIQTFDGVQYRSPLSTCWSLLAKDCQSPQEPRFAVLMKKPSPESNQKIVKIVTPSQVVELIPESEEYESLKVKVNGRPISPSEIPEEIIHRGQVVVRIMKEGPYVRVSLPRSSVRVYFDGYACNIKLPPWMQNRQCGLCGHYNQEPSDEWMKADRQWTPDVREFAQTYTLQEEDCQWPSNPMEICPTPECSYQNPWHPMSSSHENSWELSSESKESSSSSQESSEWDLPSVEPIPRTKVIEQGSKVCFSKEPVPKCPHHTYPKTYQNTKKVVYCCLPRNDPQTSLLLRQVVQERQIPSEISSLPTSFTEQEPIPSQCKRL